MAQVLRIAGWEVGVPLAANLVDEASLVRRVEKHGVSAQLVDDAPEGPNIRPVIILLILDHLRRGIAERTDVAVADALSTHSGCYLLIVREEIASYTEITDFNFQVLSFQKDVAWLQITMHDVARVYEVQAKDNLYYEFPDFALH
jgi:hypothetical protein